MAVALGTRASARAVERPGPLRFRQAASADEVDAWEAAWRALDAHSIHPLTHFSWVRACYGVLSDDVVPRAMGAFRGSRLLAVAPLVKRRQRGVGRLFLAHSGDPAEPLDVAWTSETALARLSGVLARGGRPLVIERVWAHSPTVKFIKRAYRGRAIVVTRPRPPCPYVPLDDSWLEPQQHLSARRRADLRRARRNAERSGPVTTEIHTPDLYELPELLDTAFEVEAHSWKGEAGTALACDPAAAVLFRQYAQAACVDGILRICFLRIGGRVAAMQLAVEHGGAFWLLRIGYDARYAQCSPSVLLLRDTIRYAAEAGLASYEFLGQPEPWTTMWTRQQRPCVSLRVYPLGLRGTWALAADLAANVIEHCRD